MRYDLEKRLRVLEGKAKELGNDFQLVELFHFEDDRYLTMHEEQPIVFATIDDVETYYKEMNGSLIIDSWIPLEEWSEPYIGALSYRNGKLIKPTTKEIEQRRAEIHHMKQEERDYDNEHLFNS